MRANKLQCLGFVHAFDLYHVSKRVINHCLLGISDVEAQKGDRFSLAVYVFGRLGNFHAFGFGKGSDGSNKIIGRFFRVFVDDKVQSDKVLALGILELDHFLCDFIFHEVECIFNIHVLLAEIACDLFYRVAVLRQLVCKLAELDLLVGPVNVIG